MINKIAFTGNPYRTFAQKMEDYAQIEHLNSKYSIQILALNSKIDMLNFKKQFYTEQNKIFPSNKNCEKVISLIETLITKYKNSIENKKYFISKLFNDYHERL